MTQATGMANQDGNDFHFLSDLTAAHGHLKRHSREHLSYPIADPGKGPEHWRRLARLPSFHDTGTERCASADFFIHVTPVATICDSRHPVSMAALMANNPSFKL
jgi:hypothetical protein